MGKPHNSVAFSPQRNVGRGNQSIKMLSYILRIKRINGRIEYYTVDLRALCIQFPRFNSYSSVNFFVPYGFEIIIDKKDKKSKETAYYNAHNKKQPFHWNSSPFYFLRLTSLSNMYKNGRYLFLSLFSSLFQ